MAEVDRGAEEELAAIQAELDAAGSEGREKTVAALPTVPERDGEGGKRDRNHNRDRVATTTGFTHLSRRVRVTARVQVMMRVEMQM